MASTTATPVITGNPGGDGSLLRYTVDYTALSTSDTVKVQGLRKTTDTVLVEAKKKSVHAAYAGICEVTANRSLANQTINLVPMNATPTIAIPCEITIIRV